MGVFSVNIMDAFATRYGGEATGGAEDIVTLSLRDAGTEDGQTADEAELWMHGCMLYRPADPDGDGKCQVITAQVGPSKVAFASRDSRAGKRFGDLNKGDACFGSPTGGGMFRANGDGATSMRVAAADGTQKAWVAIEDDGTIILGNEWVRLEMGENGFIVMVGSEYFEFKPGEMVLSSSKVNLAAASVALGLGAVLPLAAVPTVPPGGFACASPVASVTVRPG